MTRYQVTAAVVVAKVDSEQGEGYFYKESLLPKAASDVVKANHAWLAEAGLVQEVEVVEVVVADPVDVDAPAFPDGDPVETWTREQLDAYAAARAVDVTGAKTKADVLALVKPV